MEALKPTGVHVHFQIYVKYQVYKKFPVDLYEDCCGWLDKSKKSFVLDWTLGKALEFVHPDGNKMRCPLNGTYTLSFKNISINERFPMIPLIPAGQYMSDNTFLETGTNTVIFSAKIFFGISDHRIEQY